MVLRVEEFIR